MDISNRMNYIRPECEVVQMGWDTSIMAQSYYYGNGGSYSDRNENGWY